MKSEPYGTHRRNAESWLPAALVLYLIMWASGCARPYEFHGIPYEPANPATEITGVNWDGAPFRLSEHKGKIALIFFGYTFCPDVCPLTLSEMKAIYRDLGDKSTGVSIVFVTVDPERDTPARLAEYIPVFDRRFYGVYLAPAALAEAKEGFDVIAEKRAYDAQTSAVGYTIDHTARVFLVDREGKLKLSFPFGTPPELIVSDLRHLLK